ncbi:MAG: RDD family protein [Deltaproteobacteria bacterium]|nr:RDD family protein [Deltaproteobacteria bacterium]
MEKEVTEEVQSENMESEAEEKEFPRANLLNRFLAKLIDFLVIGALATIVTAPIGSLAALTYSLIADGFFDGRSLGKKMIGMRVVNLRTGMPCNFKDSILRNIPIAAVVMFALIPILGWILLFTAGLVIMLFESYLIYSDEGGIRIGDIFADTQVIDTE